MEGEREPRGPEEEAEALDTEKRWKEAKTRRKKQLPGAKLPPASAK